MKKNKGGRPTKLKKIRSPRQLIAVKKLSDIVRFAGKRKGITLGKILRDSGYSDSFSEHPGRAIKAKSFQQLLEKHLPDTLITESHEGALVASKLDHYIFPANEEDGVIKETIESISGCKLIRIRKQLQWKRAYFWTPDNQSRLKAIAEAYKVKGKYPAEKHKHEGEIKVVKGFNFLPPGQDENNNPDNQTRT